MYLNSSSTLYLLALGLENVHYDTKIRSGDLASSNNIHRRQIIK